MLRDERNSLRSGSLRLQKDAEARRRRDEDYRSRDADARRRGEEEEHQARIERDRLAEFNRRHSTRELEREAARLRATYAYPPPEDVRYAPRYKESGFNVQAGFSGARDPRSQRQVVYPS